MDKLTYYLRALQAGMYRKTAWNQACYALTREGPEDWKLDPYPYRLVAQPNGYYFVHPKTRELTQITDAWSGEPLFLANEQITLKPGDADNVYEPVVTSYGNLLANYFLVIHGFGGKIPYIEGRFSAKQVEKLFTPRILDSMAGDKTLVDPDSGLERVVSATHVSSLTHTKEQAITEPIYIDEYLRYGRSAFSIVGYSQVFTPADSPKTLTAPDGLIEFRKSLLAKYRGQLHRREVVAQMVSELVDFDAKYLKGDVSEGFLISKKSRNIVRLKMYLMYGAESGIEDKIDVTLIERSLSEGWDIDHLPEMINTLRAASYNRGKQTESGGEAFKDLIRAAANLKIDTEDCGIRAGVTLETENPDWLIGFSALVNGDTVKIDKNNVGEYLGKMITLRSPAMCRGNGGFTSYCKVCMGDRLTNNPEGVALAMADYGSAFLSMFLAKAHGGSMKMKRLNLRRLMS